MTPVEFHFITPSGVPIVNAAIEIQISQAGYDAITPGILMPRVLTVNTDSLGKAMISLVSSDIMYFVTAFDPLSDAALFYKFIVPPLAVGVTFVRLQDILVEGPLPQVPYDEAALLTILTAKANTLAAAAAAEASATEATDAAATTVNAAAEAATATAQAAIAVANAGYTAADLVQTGQDKLNTAADRVQTGLDRVATGLDQVATAADRVQTGLDVVATAADRVDTAADVTQTGLDAVATAADRVQTGLDRTAAAASATTATTGATTATTKASEADASAIAAAASAVLAASTVTGVSTVNGRSGGVVLTSADVGLSNVNNTSDANKPVSTAQATADSAIQTAAATDATNKANAAQAAAIAASAPTAHVGSGGAAHANVVAAGAAGFMTGADKTKLDAVSGTNTGDETGPRIAALNHAATSKPLLVDADEIAGQDSANSFGLIRTTWTAVKAFLKTYFDTLYATLAGNTFTGAQIYGDQTLSRGMTKDMGMVFLDKGNSGTAAQTCDYTAGSHQKLTVTGAFVMNAVTNWPPTGNTGELLLELVNGASSAITWTMAGTTQKWWKADGTSVSSIGSSGVTLQASGTDWILMWSTDAGTTTNFKVMR